MDTRETPVFVAPDSDNAAGYDITGVTYFKTSEIVVDQRCNGFTAINRGTLVASVNGIPLNPPSAPGQSGESFAVGGNFGEIFKGRLQLLIPAADPAPALVLIQKTYL